MCLKLGRSIGRRLVVRSAHRSKVGVRVLLHHSRVLRRDRIRDWRLRLQELSELLHKLEVLVLQVRLEIGRRVLSLQRLALARAHKSARTKGRTAARGAGRRFRGDIRRRLDYVRVAVGGGRQQVGGLVLDSRTCTLIMSLPLAASNGFAMAEWLNMSKNCSSGRRAQAARPPGGRLRSCWRSRGGWARACPGSTPAFSERCMASASAPTMEPIMIWSISLARAASAGFSPTSQCLHVGSGGQQSALRA